MSAERKPNGGGDVVVIGLGRFGTHLAETLIRLGHDVLAIDRDPAMVQRWAPRLDRVVQADATEEAALRQLAIGDFARAVVCIGASVEASVLTVLVLAELGVPEIWARATSVKHSKILSSVGADHVVFPEAETGERVAHLIVSSMLDFIEFGDDFAIAKVRVPEALLNRPLSEVRIPDRHGVMVIGTKLPGERFRYAEPETVLLPGSLLIVEGPIDQVESFASLA